MLYALSAAPALAPAPDLALCLLLLLQVWPLVRLLSQPCWLALFLSPLPSCLLQVDVRADKKKIKQAVQGLYEIQTKKINTLIRWVTHLFRFMGVRFAFVPYLITWVH